VKGSEHLLVSDDFLESPQLPKRITFIGAGVIAFEFAFVAASLGSDVTIVHRSNQPLKGFDASMVERFLHATEKAGIRLVTNAPAKEIKKQVDEYTLITETGLHVKADAVYETIGRVPDLSVLEGGKSGVEASAKGIVVNAYMQSVSNPHVYAVGDCTQTPYQLATVADEQGKIAGENILKGNHLTWDDAFVASAMFTHPPLATVGITEKEAKEQGLDYVIKEGETAKWPSSKRIGETDGAYKMVLSRDGRLLGATLLRHNAPEVTNLCAMLLKTDMPISTFKHMALAYPTASSDLKNML
jgi:glutathione reductase (NADPH)